MKKETFWKALGAGMLAASLFASPLAGVNALAVKVTPGQDVSIPVTGGTTEGGESQPTTAKEGGSVKEIDPTKSEGGTSQTEIPVWGFTKDMTVYSVDVEWGAMTFQWEGSTWNPKTHTNTEDGGWKVYDSVNDVALDKKEDAINEIKVTNHSNRGIWATLTYGAEAGYTDTTGTFSFTDEAGSGESSVLTAAAGSVPAYLSLATADNNGGEGEGVGKETVGKAYFMPDGIGADNKANGIEKWKQIGTITVGIKTKQPTAP